MGGGITPEIGLDPLEAGLSAEAEEIRERQAAVGISRAVARVPPKVYGGGFHPEQHRRRLLRA